MRGFPGRGEGARAAPDGGFTLVELLVVLTIVGLAAAAVLLAIPDPGGSLASEAERFAARAKNGRDSALLESRAVALEVGPGGYGLARRVGGEWQPAASFSWNENTRAELGGRTDASARTVFDPTGLADPLYLTLRRREERIAVEIGHDGDVAIRR